MKSLRKDKDELSGFTLVELLVAVAIVGVLVTLAMPRYKAFVARSRQAEARNNLGTIRKLQESYWMHQVSLGVASTAAYYQGLLGGVDACGSADTKNALGFRLTDCNQARYRYNATSTATGGATGSSVHGTKKVYPDCSKDDAWSMAQDTGSLSNSPDVVAECSE